MWEGALHAVSAYASEASLQLLPERHVSIEDVGDGRYKPLKFHLRQLQYLP